MNPHRPVGRKKEKPITKTRKNENPKEVWESALDDDTFYVERDRVEIHKQPHMQASSGFRIFGVS
jgi:hypothetical protein